MAGVERIIVSALVFSGCTEYGNRYYRRLNGLRYDGRNSSTSVLTSQS